jgi:predicted glycosyltransferase
LETACPPLVDDPNVQGPAGTPRPEPRTVVRNRRARSRASVRIAFYSHDTLGLGHTRRNLLIATALTRSGLQVDMLLITGTSTASRFALPPGTDCLTLPSLRKDLDGNYASRSLDMPLGELVSLRSEAIWGALKGFGPDLLVVDNVPRGVAGELDLSLRKLKKHGRTKCVLGLRDVLDAHDVVTAQWAARDTTRTITTYYHAVWVYGDPLLHATLPETERAVAADRLHYLGYFDPLLRLVPEATASEQARAVLAWAGRPFVMCTVGGGQDGVHLAQAFLRTRLAGRRGVLLTGPFMHPGARQALTREAAARDDLLVVDFLEEPLELMPHADRIVSMGGYNSVLEGLACERPLLVVPRVAPRQEQWIRAERLREVGLLDVLHPASLGPHALEAWLGREAPSSTARKRLEFLAHTRLPTAIADVIGRPLVPRRAPFAAAEEGAP